MVLRLQPLWATDYVYLRDANLEKVVLWISERWGFWIDGAKICRVE
jgi:hypothetical protein